MRTVGQETTAALGCFKYSATPRSITDAKCSWICPVCYYTMDLSSKYHYHRFLE